MLVKEDYNEEEIVPEVPKYEILREDDLERGDNEVIENEVLDKVSKNAEDELQKEFENEIKKIRLGMLQMIEQLQNMEKVKEVDEI